ncbi:restriction endonuclease subunit S [Aulosira sp. FACHB-615]|uniref:restriction endonuclease subunit S n=1 Tax=Aulosira sp. FACHB-615 TaxID=2692777 RepID=UPI00168A217D|nr:restriction endonuclease subunit S [Aulosira sp. FACHB-615]MBD2492414.1 restriction endonuclease subunit S [Aulosira sp. FACHB-615]
MIKNKDELPELPKKWVWSQVSDIAEIIMGQSPPGDTYNQQGVGVPLINGPVEFGPDPFSKTIKSKFTTLPTKMCKEGDLILCVRGSTTGRMNIAGFEACIGRGVAAIRSRIYQEYLNIFIHFNEYQIYRLGTGSTFPNVSADILNKIVIPLPPLNEQRRIVAKIEALKARSQRVKDALEDIPQLLDQFRQSVLAAAFRGDLTADWREQNSNVEPASVLLERIRVERRRKWSEELYKKQKSVSKVKNYEPIKPDIDKLPQLPESWIWVTLDQLLFSLRNGLSKPPADELPGIPILRISSVRAMEVNINDIRFYRTENTDDLSNYFLETGDLLFTRYNGSRSFVGVCGIVPKIINDLLYPDKLIRGQLVDNLLSLPEYLELACNCGLSRSHIERHIKTSAGQQGIAGSDIKSMPIPLPPLAEQHTIVCAVKQEFAAIQNLASLTNSCLQDLQSLNQSILAKAFRGELVPQDPNDEPASVLLERIHAERDKLETKTTKKSTAKTSTRRTNSTQSQTEEPVQLELGLE